MQVGVRARWQPTILFAAVILLQAVVDSGWTREPFERIIGDPDWGARHATPRCAGPKILEQQRRLYLGERNELDIVKGLFQFKSIAPNDPSGFRYLLFSPEPRSGQSKYPLVVWLHGAGDGEEDLHHHLTFLSRYFFPPPWERSQYPFYFVSPLAPPRRNSWLPQSAEDLDAISLAAQCVDLVLNENPAIARDQVTLVGASMGGSGCWELAIRYPEFFAAVAPIASRGSNRSDLSALDHVSVWAFHSTEDPVVPITGVRRSIRMLKSHQTHALLTEFVSKDHDAWSIAMDEYHLLDWLIAQRKGGSDSPRPGLRRRPMDSVWYLALSVATAGLLAALWVWIPRRRRSKPSQSSSIDDTAHSG